MEYQVKGSSIRSKLEFALETFGQDAEARLRSHLATQGIAFLLDSEWYSFKIFDDLCVTLARWHYGGDLRQLVEVGRFSARKTLSTTYAAYAKGQSFLQFLDRIASLHSRFYNQGAMHVQVDPQGTACTIQLREAPEYSDADLYIAVGFYLGAAEACGLDRVTWTMDRRAGGVDFRLQWLPAGARQVSSRSS
jgi:hypothetical protein